MSPLYDIRCDGCNNEFETFLSYDNLDKDLKPKQIKCPKCQSKKTRKIIKSSVPVIFKGSGFTKSTGGGE